jgi:hypothetical protein
MSSARARSMPMLTKLCFSPVMSVLSIVAHLLSSAEGRQKIVAAASVEAI